MRLGLFTIPERHYDPVGTNPVVDYFGNIVYEYPLSLAIADGRLCRYRYYPIPVALTDAETDAYDGSHEAVDKAGRVAGRGEKQLKY